MKIAIIGTGIAGNVAAYHLSRDHRITVFEANDYIGGHSHTHEIEWEGQRYQLDSGFMVFNHQTYPCFTRLLKELDVPAQSSSMGFSVKCDRSDLEYNGTTLNTLFAQRRNLIRPSFYRMIKDILRFNREAPQCLARPDMTTTLGDYLKQAGYGREFLDRYLIPMGAAIWSADPSQMWAMPAQFFIRFFHNHGMLSVNDRPTWYVVRGGSQEYVKKLTAPFRDRIRTNAPVESIKRNRDFVTVTGLHGSSERFDAVFIATHGDQALRLLSDATALEEEVLGPMTTQNNEAVLHTDAGMLPTRRRAWAAWNYHIPIHAQNRVAVTYNLNILQGLHAPVQFCVTLDNSREISPTKILKRMIYAHPIFSIPSVLAQQRQAEINGRHRTYFCGAYWRYGFHEDGVVSALNALEHFKRTPHHAELSVPGTNTPSAV
ncbi:MAG: FAD-dependent oxidoreductase [Nitrospirota bacterium]|nr:FAD-dependent oxidoreductase [Nitrospirota bacterium]